ncbi:MAG: tRNA-dihydrouridine synthase family protein [Phycisphaerales bacterium]|nr:tRNA-dihydrouridine synthase family protein [Phycisphaerales bacterium]
MLATPLILRAPDGSVRLESNLLLAPIAGWCELAWRVTCRELGGVGLACTDLLSPQGLLLSKETTKDLAQTNEFDKPIGMQLYGSDAEILAKGAEWCAEHGATVVDINMGCPVDKVTKKDGGSKLMCDLGSTFRVFERVREAMPGHVPLTAKMRLGWSQEDADNGVAGKLAIGLIQRGAAMITVHGRTTEQRFKGSCSHDGIRRVVEMVAEETGAYDGTVNGGVPVIGNGDIKLPIDIITMMKNTNCAGVMIGRGSFGDPWLFRVGWALQQRVASGQDPEAVDLRDVLPSEEEKLDMLERFFARMVEHRDEAHALHVFRQRISLLGKRINGGHCRPLKDAIREAKDAPTVLAAISAWRSGNPLGGAIKRLEC